MKNKRLLQILALVVVLSMIFTTAAFATPGHKQFERDSKQYELDTDEYDKALKSLIEKEIVKGYGKGEYGLSGNVKRGDVIVMIVRAFELEKKYDVSELSEKFLDIVDKNDYFYGPVNIAKKLGIAKGDGKYFKPNKPVTIQEAIWLIERSDDLINESVHEDTIKWLKDYYEGKLNDFAKRRDVFWMLYFVLDGKAPDDNKEEDKLKDIVLDIDDDSELAFLDSWFNRAFNVLKDADNDVEDLEYVKFELPIKNGTLYYDYEEDEYKNVLVDEKTKYYLAAEADDDDKEIKNITLVPKVNFSGTISIKYNAFDEDGVSYPGLMKITVKSNEEVQEIKTITLTMDEDDITTFDFLEELEKKTDLINSDLIDELEYVKFKLVDRGELTIDYADSNGIKVKLNEVYYFDHIDDDLTFKYTGTNTANIQFTVYDDDDKPYDGLIKIVPEEEKEIKIETISLKMDRDDVEEIDFLAELEGKVDLIDDKLFDKLDYVKFTSIDRGELAIDYANVDDVKVKLNKIYYFDHIDDDLTFNYTETSTANIQFTVYDIEGNVSFDGLIKITN